MKSRNRSLSDESRLWRIQIRQAVLFWLLWTIYVCISTILVAALLTNWPKFLHR